MVQKNMISVLNSFLSFFYQIIICLFKAKINVSFYEFAEKNSLLLFFLRNFDTLKSITILSWISECYTSIILVCTKYEICYKRINYHVKFLLGLFLHVKITLINSCTIYLEHKYLSNGPLLWTKIYSVCTYA